jgi:hypothetical protein
MGSKNFLGGCNPEVFRFPALERRLLDLFSFYEPRPSFLKVEYDVSKHDTFARNNLWNFSFVIKDSDNSPTTAFFT